MGRQTPQAWKLYYLSTSKALRTACAGLQASSTSVAALSPPPLSRALQFTWRDPNTVPNERKTGQMQMDWAIAKARGWGSCESASSSSSSLSSLSSSSSSSKFWAATQIYGVNFWVFHEGLIWVFTVSAGSILENARMEWIFFSSLVFWSRGLGQLYSTFYGLELASVFHEFQLYVLCYDHGAYC
jgi:hypothetical protein